MLTSFYTASTGTVTQQTGLGIIANNISNMSTAGYQPDRASFSDLVYTNLHSEQEESARRQAGHGEKLEKTDNQFSYGGMNNTGRNLDYALSDGNSFFAVRTTDGSVKYTRCGSFYQSQAGDGNYYLADSVGGRVLDGNGNPIQVTDESNTLPVGVYQFKNRDGLLKSGDNYFEATNVSGPAVSVEDADARQGYLENSGVDLSDQMYDLIATQKSFAFNVKLVQISDEVTQSVNNLR